MQQVEVHELNGVQKRCSELKVSFKLKTAADFTQKPYRRQFFKMTKTAANNFPIDARPALYIDEQNRILLSNSPFLTVNNRWTTHKPHFFWPTGMLANYGDAESFNTDSTMRVEADTLYEISIEWQVNVNGSPATRDQIIFTVNDSVTRMDFTFGDYFCHNYMDMLISFGETAQNHVTAGFENVQGVISDVKVDGLCPIPVPEPTIANELCCNADFCNDQNCTSEFKPCDNFDEYECSSACDISQTVEPVTLAGAQTFTTFPLAGVQKRCSELKISFELRTAASFTQKSYLRQFFKLTKTAANSFPIDARPSLYIDSQNRILLANSPFLTVNNRWTTKNYFFWPTGMQAGKGDAEMFNTDSTMRVVADTLYRVFFPKMSHLGVKHGHLGPFLSQKT